MLSPDGCTLPGMTTTTNPVNWFEIATTDREKARAFYGELFGWSYSAIEDYTIVDCGEGAPIQGGIVELGGGAPTYAMPFTMVADVPATCQKAADLGATVVHGPETQPNGIVLAHLRDLDGNLVGVYAPPPEAA